MASMYKQGSYNVPPIYPPTTPSHLEEAGVTSYIGHSTDVRTEYM